MPNTKKVKLTLVGLDGNAFSLMGAFEAQAKKEGWTSEEIEEVLDKCMSGDYNNLLRTLMDVCEDDSDGRDEEYDEDECNNCGAFENFDEDGICCTCGH